MVRVRNPWGYDSYHGPYSDADTASWTPALREDLNWPESEADKENGVSWMTYDYYVKHVLNTKI